MSKPARGWAVVVCLWLVLGWPMLADGAESAGQATSEEQPGENLSEMTMDQLISLRIGNVYGASKYWQETVQAPGVVTILTSEEIKLYGHRTLAEALRSAPGLYVTYDRNYSYLGIGGFNRGDLNSHVLVMVDGHRVNDTIQDAVMLGHNFDVDIDLIDRIEIVQGPGSAVYGNNAFLGVVNVITKSGKTLNAAEVSGSYESFDSFKGRFSYGKRLENDLDVVFSGTYFQTAGPEKLYYPEFDDPSSNNGIARNVDDEQSVGLFSRVSWQGLSLGGSYTWREKTIPTGSYGTVFNSDRNKTIDARGMFDLKYEREFAGSLDFHTRVYYDYTGYDGHYLYADTNAVSGLVLNRDQFRGDRWGTEAQVSKSLFERHVLVGGFEFRGHPRELMQNFNDRPREVFLDERRDSWALGVFGEGEAEIARSLKVHAGLRYDYYDLFGGTVNPRAAVVYLPWPQTALKAIFGTAYRTPNAYELFYSDGGLSTEPNPDLDPESITTYQVVWNQELPHGVRLEVSGFNYQVEDLLSQATNPDTGLLRYVNFEKVEALGIQAGVRKNWSSGSRASLSYTFQQVEDRKTDRLLSNSPQHLLKAAVVLPVVQEVLFTSFELQYYGKSDTLSGGETSDFWLSNITLYSQRIIKGMELSAGLYNVFDQDFAYPGRSEHVQDEIPQDGRTFRVKLTYRF